MTGHTPFSSFFLCIPFALYRCFRYPNTSAKHTVQHMASLVWNVLNSSTVVSSSTLLVLTLLLLLLLYSNCLDDTLFKLSAFGLHTQHRWVGKGKRQQKKTTAEHKQKDFVSLYFPHFVRCPYIAIPYCRNIYVRARVCIYQTLDRLRTTCQYIYCKYLYISISSHRVPSDNQHFVQEATGGHTTSVSVIKSSGSSSRSIRSFRNRILILLWVSNNL